MKHSYCIIGVFSGLLLLGAGCASSPVAEKTPVSAPVKAPEAVPAPVPTSSAPGTATAAGPMIDATWKTFTSKSLNFSFQYPPKGPLAPTFEISYLRATDTNITDGCFVDDGVKSTATAPEKTTVNGIELCHTGFTDRAMMHGQEHDYWTTKKGSQYILVTFTSKTYIADMSVIEGCQSGGNLVNTATCKPFDLDGYHAMLALIMSTFTFAK